MSLLAELKRRRVFRVAGGYVVASWIVLQMADVLAPALHLPTWTITFVALLVIIGFPIAVFLGWAFDLTPAGLSRGTGTLRFPWRSTVAATAVVALAAAGFVAVKRRAVAAHLDANAVAVLPFRVSGDASLASLREGMVDLLAASLTGEGGPRALDSRTTLSAWRRRVDSEDHDLPAADAVRLARSLGAGQLLLGELVGTPGRATIHATLLSAIDGRTLSTADAAASPDSLLQLVERIVVGLLSRQADQGEHTKALLSESLGAVRAYLSGMQSYRRGDYVKASQYFGAALDEDSTFALASCGLMLAKAWAGYGADFRRGREVCWRYRERLSPADREELLAYLGERYPVPASPEAELRAWRGIVAHRPDRVEAWYRLGDVYFHFGARLGIADPIDRAMSAWSRAAALDSSFMPALEHQFEVFAERGDTAAMRRLAALVYGRVRPELKYTSTRAWVAATALHDEAWLAELRRSAGRMQLVENDEAHRLIVRLGLSQTDLPLLTRVGAASGPTGAMWAALSLLNAGRPAAALAIVRSGLEGDLEQTARMLAFGASYSELSSPALDSAADRLERGGSPTAKCVAGLYRLAHDRFEGASAAIEQLRAAVAAQPEALATTVQPCVEFISAYVKVRSHSPDAPAALARVDSLLLHGPVAEGWYEGFTQGMTRIYLQMGDNERALRAASSGGISAFAYAPLLLERARLSARLGRRADAIAAYVRYLKVRANPEPGPAAELTERARQELADLVQEGRR